MLSERASSAVLNCDLHLTHCSHCFHKTSSLIPYVLLSIVCALYVISLSSHLWVLLSLLLFSSLRHYQHRFLMPISYVRLVLERDIVDDGW